MKSFKLATTLAALALAATLCACTSTSSTYAQETLTDASGIKVTAENADSSSSATTEDAITVNEGDVIVISPFTDKGSFHLTITAADGTNIYDDDAEGKVLYTIAAAPGEYSVTTSGNNVTGWMTVFAQSQDELAAQDEALDSALEEAAPEAAEAAETSAE